MSSDRDEFNSTADEIVSLYGRGQRIFYGVELAEDQSFAGAILKGATFRNAWLHSTNFSGADLRDAVFENSCVKCVDFSSADLRGVQFRGVVLCGSDFSGARLEGATAHDTTWYGAEVDDMAAFQR